LVASLARPGGNVTGQSDNLADLIAKPIELVRELVPDLRRVAALWNPDHPLSASAFHRGGRLAVSAGIEVTSAPVATSDQIEPALAALASKPPQVLFVHPTQPLGLHSARIADFAVKHGIAAMGSSDFQVRDGFLLAYGPSFVEAYRRTAYYVNRILRGAVPSDLPIELPTHRLTINLRTARALGLTIPPAILVRADEVIE
jgi:putative ABC transport system substrate-binding protein